MDYKQIAEAIQCDVEDIKERAIYLLGQLEEAKSYLPDNPDFIMDGYAIDSSGSEMEYAIGDVQNLLSLLFSSYSEHENKVA